MASSINCCSANLRVSGNRNELDRLDGDGNLACAGVNVYSAAVRTAKGGSYAGEDRHRDASHQRNTWDSPAGSPLLGLIRSVVGNENAAAMLREFVSREVVGRLAEALERDQPQVRASLVASQLVGLAMLRYVIKLEPLASASSKQIATWVGPAIQRYLTDPSVTDPEPRG